MITEHKALDLKLLLQQSFPMPYNTDCLLKGLVYYLFARFFLPSFLTAPLNKDFL